MQKKTNISLQLLMLNDLLRANIINKDIYNRAVEKINSIKNDAHVA